MDEKFFVNKDYEAYNIYLSIRAHFHGRTGKGFDIKNSNYTANMPFAKYQAKSAIVIMFKKLTEKFQRQEVRGFVVNQLKHTVFALVYLSPVIGFTYMIVQLYNWTS